MEPIYVPRKRGSVVAEKLFFLNASSFVRTRNVCCEGRCSPKNQKHFLLQGNKICYRNKRCVYAQIGKHLRKQCFLIYRGLKRISQNWQITKFDSGEQVAGGNKVLSARNDRTRVFVFDIAKKNKVSSLCDVLVTFFQVFVFVFFDWAIKHSEHL